MLRVRRGRHGSGLSLPQARAYLTKRLCGGFFRGSQADMRTLAAEILNCLPADVDVERGDPGEVLVRLPADASDADVARAWRALEDVAPATGALCVDRHSRPKTRAARGRDPWVGGKATE